MAKSHIMFNGITLELFLLKLATRHSVLEVLVNTNNVNFFGKKKEVMSCNYWQGPDKTLIIHSWKWLYLKGPKNKVQNC